jgi:hypothetical protein
MRKLRWLTVIQNTVATGKFGNRNMRLSGLRPPPLGGVVALDWRQKIIKETVPSSKHIHQPEEEDQGLTDGPHTKADLTVVEPNLEHLPPVEDYQIVLAIFAVSLSFSTQLPKSLIPTPQGTIPTYAVTGASLILELEKILLRVPVPPEGDVIFTAANLQAWATDFWSMIQ